MSDPLDDNTARSEPSRTQLRSIAMGFVVAALSAVITSRTVSSTANSGVSSTASSGVSPAAEACKQQLTNCAAGTAGDIAETDASTTWSVKGDRAIHRPNPENAEGSDIYVFPQTSVTAVRLTISALDSRAGIVFAMTGQSTYLRLVASPELQVVAVQKIDGGSSELVKFTRYSGDETLEVRLENGSMTARVNSNVLWSSDGARVDLGGVGLTAPSTGNAEFVNVTVDSDS